MSDLYAPLVAQTLYRMCACIYLSGETGSTFFSEHPSRSCQCFHHRPTFPTPSVWNDRRLVRERVALRQPYGLTECKTPLTMGSLPSWIQHYVTLSAWFCDFCFARITCSAAVLLSLYHRGRDLSGSISNPVSCHNRGVVLLSFSGQ